MASLPVKQARKWREQLTGFQFWLAGYVIFLFLIGLEQPAEFSILARKMRRNARWNYYNLGFSISLVKKMARVSLTNHGGQ